MSSSSGQLNLLPQNNYTTDTAVNFLSVVTIYEVSLNSAYAFRLKLELWNLDGTTTQYPATNYIDGSSADFGVFESNLQEIIYSVWLRRGGLSNIASYSINVLNSYPLESQKLITIQSGATPTSPVEHITSEKVSQRPWMFQMRTERRERL